MADSIGSDFECAFLYTLQHIGSAATIPKPEKVAAVRAVCEGKDVFVCSYKGTEGDRHQPIQPRAEDCRSC